VVSSYRTRTTLCCNNFIGQISWHQKSLTMFFLKEFNNREIAIGIWLGIVVLILLMSGKIRNSVADLIKSFFHFQLMSIFLSILIYECGIILLLYHFGLWTSELLKDSIFWFCGLASPLVFKVAGKVNAGFFNELVKKSVKWTILVEFISNLYVFSLPMELVLIPSIIFFSMMKPVADSNSNTRMIARFSKNMLAGIGLFGLLYAIAKTVQHYTEVFSWETAKEIIISLLLTILYLPFLYLLTLKIKYNEFLTLTKFCLRDTPNIFNVYKKETYRTAGFNLKKLSNISENTRRVDLKKIKNVRGFLIAKTSEKKALQST